MKFKIKFAIFLFVLIGLIYISCSRNKDQGTDTNSYGNTTEGINTKSSIEIHEQNPKIKFSNLAKGERETEERRIYLLDLTRSMEGFNGNEDIFQAVKNQLKNAIINLQDTTTEIIFIPFTNTTFEPYVNTISEKDSILAYINRLQTKKGDTNILSAWKKGKELLEPSKINYMFMLTDGIHNSGEPIDSLYEELNRWYPEVKDTYNFSFYVLLTENAREKEICKIIDISKQMWLVPTMNINTNFIRGQRNLSANIIKTNKIRIHLNTMDPEIFNQGFKFKISVPQNEYYRIVNATEQIDKDGYITFEIEKLKEQKDLPISYQTKLSIEYDKEKFPLVFFTPDEYNFKIVNVGSRKMTINIPQNEKN